MSDLTDMFRRPAIFINDISHWSFSIPRPGAVLAQDDLESESSSVRGGDAGNAVVMMAIMNSMCD